MHAYTHAARYADGKPNEMPCTDGKRAAPRYNAQHTHHRQRAQHAQKAHYAHAVGCERKPTKTLNVLCAAEVCAVQMQGSELSIRENCSGTLNVFQASSATPFSPSSLKMIVIRDL